MRHTIMYTDIAQRGKSLHTAGTYGRVVPARAEIMVFVGHIMFYTRVMGVLTTLS